MILKQRSIIYCGFPLTAGTSGTLDQTAPAWNLISSLQIKICAMLFGLTLECTLNTLRNATSFLFEGIALDAKSLNVTSLY